MTGADLTQRRLQAAQTLKAFLSERFTSLESVIRSDGELIVKTSGAEAVAVADALAGHESHPCRYLSCVSGVDWPDRGKVEVVYTLHSMPDPAAKVSLRVEADRSVEGGGGGKVPSLTGVWPTADYQEREVFDLLGVDFEGHPDLRRILLDDSFEGHPLRKDFVDQRAPHRRVTRRDYQP